MAAAGTKPRHLWLGWISLLDPVHQPESTSGERIRYIHARCSITERSMRKTQEDREVQKNRSSCSSLWTQLENHSPKRRFGHVLSQTLSQHPEPHAGTAPASALGHRVSDKSSQQMCSGLANTSVFPALKATQLSQDWPLKLESSVEREPAAHHHQGLLGLPHPLQ